MSVNADVKNLEAWAGVKICSCNVSSLNLSQKNINSTESMFMKKISSILKNNADIFLLQDTRVSDKSHLLKNHLTCTEWGNYDLYINSSMNRRGVVTIIKKSSNIEVIEQLFSDDQNSLILKIKKNDYPLIIVNIYGPTQGESPNFLIDLKNILAQYANLPILLSGDFNCISNTTKPISVRDKKNKDLIGTTNIPNPRNSKIIENWHRQGFFFDAFRVQNPDVTEYSFISFNVASTQRSRIDLTLVNESALKMIKKVEYNFQPSFFDHKIQTISLMRPETLAPKPDMKNIEAQGIKETVLMSIINTCLDYSIWNQQDRNPAAPSDPEYAELYTPAHIFEHVKNLTGKLELIKSVITLELATSDLWLKIIIEEKIADFWDYYHQNINLEFIQNSDKSINDSLFLQTTINNLSNEILTLQTSQRKSENKKKDDLYKKLTSILNESPINPTELTEIELLIRSFEEEKADAICSKNKKWQTLNNERGSRAFCSLNKETSSENDFNVLLDCDFDPPRPFENEKVKGFKTNGFYTNLFKCVDNEVNISIEEFLGPELSNSPFVREKILSIDERDQLDLPITLQELRDSVKSSNSTSAPGFDMHNYLFIKTYLKYLEVPMINCYKLWILNGSVSDNFGISKVRLIPKKKNLFNIKQWRPISLLSVYYKIFSGIVAQRLKTVTDKITSECQKSYSSKRNIAEVNVDMVNLLKSASFTETSLAIVSIDFRKAFDSISHKYIISCLRFFGFGDYFIQLTLACIKGKKGFIANLKDSGETFPVNSGVAQGDRPSGPLFNIVLEPLLILIQKCNILTDAMIRKTASDFGPERPLSRRLFTYADDLNAILRATIENIKRLKEILDRFYKTSALRCNLEKTSVCPINTSVEFEQQIAEEGLTVEKKFVLLGVKYDHEGKNIDSENQQKIIDKITGLSNFWGKFYLTIPGKISVVKTFMYSQIGYFAPFLIFNNEFCTTIELIIENFINKDQNVGNKKCFVAPNLGGLGLFKVRDYIDGIKVSFFRRHFHSHDLWAQSIQNSKEAGNKTKIHDINHLKLMFPASAELCVAYERFCCGFYKYPGNVAQNPVLDNPSIRDHGSPLTQSICTGLNYEDCLTLSNLKVSDLCDDNNIPLSTASFNVKNHSNIPPRIHRLLVRSTACIREKIIPDLPRQPSIIFLITSKKKGSKLFRNYLNPPPNINTVKNFTATRSRQNWYNFEINPYEEMKLLKSWTNSGFPNDIRETLMLVIMNLYKVNVHRSKFRRFDDGTFQSALCKSCELTMGANAPRENYPHLFRHCPSTAELNNRIDNAKKSTSNVSIHSFFITDGSIEINYVNRVILSLLIYHLTKLRNTITDRNGKIINSLKKSLYEYCKVKPSFFPLLREVFTEDFLGLAD